MKPNFAIVFAICIIVSIPLCAQQKYSKVKIPIQSSAQRSEVIRALQLDHFASEGNAIICEIGSDEMFTLSKLSFAYEVLVDDVSSYLTQINADNELSLKNGVAAAQVMGFDRQCKTTGDLIKAPAAFTTNGAMGGYYNFAEMVAAMDALVAANPAIVQKFSLGKSGENRDIWCIKISDNVATDEAEPEVLYSGLQHAREAITGTSLIFFMQYLVENYSDARVNALVNNREIFIVPCVNPDGYVHNQTTNPSGGGMWRKNKNMTLGDGVDLNRNYNVDWGRTGGGSSNPGDETYWGTAAFSEKETQVMRSFITARNFVVAIDQHCYGPYYSLPFGFRTGHSLSTVDQNFYTFIPALMGKYNCHRAGNSYETVGYEVAGGIKDYFVLGDIGLGSKQKVLGMTGEAGGGSFWAPKTSIIKLSQGLCFQNLQLALSAGSYADLQDVNDIDLSVTSGSFSFLLRRVGVGNDPVTVTMVPIENVQSVGAAVTTSLNAYYPSFTGSISYSLPASIPNGARIKFAWKVETGGMTTYDTIVKFYNPNILLDDNMEGTLAGNWTVPNGGGANTKWDLTTNAFYAGTKSLAESPTGDYSAGGERIVTYKNSFSLTAATGAYLSFWVKHRAENCNDKLQVQVSTNGASWTPLCGQNTVSENDGTLGGQPALTGIRENWTKEVYDLSNYINNSSVQFRFVFTSNTDAAGDNFYKKVDDGFYIDNVKLIKTSAVLTTLPVTFLDFWAKLLDNNSVALNWEAYADNQHDYFEVERSSDGANFKALGRGSSRPPYKFTDQYPELGQNFYRIKQVDKDGSASYSKIITVVINRNFNVTVYPNPATDKLFIKTSGRERDKIRLQLLDVHSRKAYERDHVLNKGENELTISIENLKKQYYILQIWSSSGRLQLTQKILKM